MASNYDFVEDFSTDDENEIGLEEEEEDPNQLWEVEDVLERRGERDAQEVLIRWKDYSSEFDSWIDLQSNSELKSFVERNQANPDSSSLARRLVPTMTLMTSTGSAFAKLYLMSLEHSMQRQMLTAEGHGGPTLNFPSPKRLS